MNDFRFKKLMCMIPEDLFLELQEKKFGSDFDSWLAEAIKEKLDLERAIV